MGEVAELVLEGVFCNQCGSTVDGRAVGYPRPCDDCAEEEDEV